MEKIKKTDSLRKIFIKISYQKSPFSRHFRVFYQFLDILKFWWKIQKLKFLCKFKSVVKYGISVTLKIKDILNWQLRFRYLLTTIWKIGYPYGYTIWN